MPPFYAVFLQGFESFKLFPCNYFPFNSFYIQVILSVWVFFRTDYFSLQKTFINFKKKITKFYYNVSIFMNSLISAYKSFSVSFSGKGLYPLISIEKLALP